MGNYLRKFEPYKTMGLDRLHLRVLRSWLVSLQGYSLSYLKGGGTWGRTPATEEGLIMYPSKKKKNTVLKTANYRVVIFS